MFATAEAEVVGHEVNRFDVDRPFVTVNGVVHHQVLRCEDTYFCASGPVQVMRSLYSTRKDSERAICPMELQAGLALLHGPEQIADLPVPVAESPGAVRIGHPERSHLVEYLAPNSVFNSLPRQRSSPHLRPDDRLVTIDRVLHHASFGVA